MNWWVPEETAKSALLKWASTGENLSTGFANNKGADQPAQMRSLLSVFVISLIDKYI